MTSCWLIISETENDGTETRLGEYGADSSMFDLNAVLAESEDVLRGLMNANIYYMDAPEGDFHSKVRFIAERDSARLIAGLIRRMAEEFHISTGWWRLHAVQSLKPIPDGRKLVEKYGIKLWKFDHPIRVQ
jgi:hypothetical protein